MSKRMVIFRVQVGGGRLLEQGRLLEILRYLEKHKKHYIRQTVKIDQVKHFN